MPHMTAILNEPGGVPDLCLIVGFTQINGGLWTDENMAFTFQLKDFSSAEDWKSYTETELNQLFSPDWPSILTYAIEVAKPEEVM